MLVPLNYSHYWELLNYTLFKSMSYGIIKPKKVMEKVALTLLV